MAKHCDFSVVNHGTLSLFYPLTDEATSFVDNYIVDDVQWLGCGFAVEHRYVDGLVNGIEEHGLTVC